MPISISPSVPSVPWRAVSDGVVLHLSVTPKSSKDSVGESVEGPSGCILKVKTRAIPDKGAANQAVVKLLAKWLGVPKTSIKIVSGSRSKLKTVQIAGNFEEIIKTLEMQVIAKETR
ncbi:MAG: hypothetical protein COA43_15245 [Robiginitomaculum sp.]|nr:MAG: hypothetical protein COA43_15245 [Robiginitomaculum sp.]